MVANRKEPTPNRNILRRFKKKCDAIWRQRRPRNTARFFPADKHVYTAREAKMCAVRMFYSSRRLDERELLAAALESIFEELTEEVPKRLELRNFFTLSKNVRKSDGGIGYRFRLSKRLRKQLNGHLDFSAQRERIQQSRPWEKSPWGSKNTEDRRERSELS